MDLLNKLKINPYNFLDIDPNSTKEVIKKAYKKKAKVLHPDKTNGKSEAEFKILYLCYKYCISNCIVVTTSDFKDLKEAERTEELSYSRNFYRTDFENKDIRHEIYADDDINFEDFEKHMKRVQGMSTTYSPENFYKKEIVESIKTNGKFDKDKFNAFFLKLQKDKKIYNQLEKKANLKAFNEDDKYMSVNIYEDMTVTLDKTKHKGNYKKLMKQEELSQTDIDSVLNTDIKTINKLIKEHKKETGKISRKKIKELISKKSENVQVDDNLSFAEMGRRIELENIERIKREKAEQKKYVDANKRIFQNMISYK